MHGDQLRGHLLAHELLRQRPLLHEHVHLYAVAEGLVHDHASGLRRADTVVLAGRDGLALQKLQRHLRRVPHAVPHPFQKLRSAQIGEALIASLNLLSPRCHDAEATCRPEHVLLHVPVPGQEELAVFLIIQERPTVQDPLVVRSARLADPRQLPDDFLVAVFRRVDFVFRAVSEHQRLILQHGIDAALHALWEMPGHGDEVALYLRNDFLHPVFGNLIEGILSVAGAVVDLHHKSPAGPQAHHADVRGGPGYGILLCLGVGGQYGGVWELLQQPVPQTEQNRLYIAQIFACFYLHILRFLSYI